MSEIRISIVLPIYEEPESIQSLMHELMATLERRW